MKNHSTKIVVLLLIIAIFYLTKGLIIAASFFIPLFFAILISLVCIPLSRKLEGLRISRALSSLVCVTIAITLYFSFFLVIFIQGQNISEKWPEMQKELKPKFSQVLSYLEEKSGANIEDQLPSFIFDEENTESETEETSEDEGDQSPVSNNVIQSFIINTFEFIGNSLLTFVYLFFMLTYRKKIKLSILKFFSSENKKSTEIILNQAVSLALNFLAGRIILLIFLAVIYAIGLQIAGVDNVFLISLIAALLSLIPYLGVVLGFVLAMAYSLFSGVDTTSLIIVAATYSLAQFIESYILEPYVVGDKVHLNPLMTILVVIIGGMLWGVSGMILSIPIAAILKICFDASETLAPLGYLLGDEDLKKNQDNHFLGRLGQKIWSKIKSMNS
ncbi:AI-2E family transporter [Belliella sp. DSM 111904]|uniref:AI-2E family transporter n=1 Tax=Belliella filtrata TaxID=2923435 RepID=A0ABS9V321_9BACT|nr:AI-2E family transporter [Belliella filtrata]MCH7410604.1 AI-2E family transporter [Belliella filtrata]